MNNFDPWDPNLWKATECRKDLFKYVWILGFGKQILHVGAHSWELEIEVGCTVLTFCALSEQTWKVVFFFMLSVSIDL